MEIYRTCNPIRPFCAEPHTKIRFFVAIIFIFTKIFMDQSGNWLKYGKILKLITVFWYVVPISWIFSLPSKVRSTFWGFSFISTSLSRQSWPDIWIMNFRFCQKILFQKNRNVYRQNCCLMSKLPKFILEFENFWMRWNDENIIEFFKHYCLSERRYGILQLQLSWLDYPHWK